MSAAAPLRRPFGLRTSAVPVAKPASQPVARPRPRLVLVAPSRPTAGRLPFLILLGTVLVGGLLLLLMLHTIAAQDGFRINTLQQRLTTLTDTEQGLEQQVQADSAPGALQARASGLGMVPSTVAAFHRLHGGRAVGLQQPVTVPPPVITAPSAPSKATSTKSATTATTKTGKHSANSANSGHGVAATTTSHHRARPHHHKATAGP